MMQEIGIPLCNRAVNSQANVSPPADPIAIMQIRVAGVAISDKRLEVTATRAYRPSPARMALRLALDVASLQEVSLHIPVNTRRDMAEPVRVGIHEAMTRRDVAGRAYADEPKTCPARM